MIKRKSKELKRNRIKRKRKKRIKCWKNNKNSKLRKKRNRLKSFLGVNYVFQIKKFGMNRLLAMEKA